MLIQPQNEESETNMKSKTKKRNIATPKAKRTAEKTISVGTAAVAVHEAKLDLLDRLIGMLQEIRNDAT